MLLIVLSKAKLTTMVPKKLDQLQDERKVLDWDQKRFEWRKLSVRWQKNPELILVRKVMISNLIFRSDFKNSSGIT